MGQGIYRVYNGEADHFGSSDGLSSDAVQHFYQDKEGDVWVVTSKGIDRFRNLPAKSNTAPTTPNVRGLSLRNMWRRVAELVVVVSSDLPESLTDRQPNSATRFLLQDHAFRQAHHVFSARCPTSPARRKCSS
ncbi:hypothetical protein [Acidisarcina polymorpha]|uniref:hypothetical protein n=1 Tax=Acidisarcina polymorpha TaxID=2211140 RepID=UPI0013752194